MWTGSLRVRTWITSSCSRSCAGSAPNRCSIRVPAGTERVVFALAVTVRSLPRSLVRRNHVLSEESMADHPNRPDHPNEETNQRQSPRGHGGDEGSARQSGGSQEQ